MTHRAQLRLAQKILACIESSRSPPTDPPTIEVARRMIDLANYLPRLLHQIDHGRQHQWHTADAVLQHRLRDLLARIVQVGQFALITDQSLPATGGWPQVAPPSLPTLAEVYADLRQLDEEFDQVNLVPPVELNVTTEPIELGGIQLGRFQIKLDLVTLADYADVRAFKVVALSPNTPISDSEVTHPHVRDESLCAGEATNAISLALRQGRICDAFLAIRSVLQTYNSDSPYVSLDDWEGSYCDDCNHVSRRTFTCCRCHCNFCEECIGFCDLCTDPLCTACRQTDPVSEHDCCHKCIQTCSRCGRLVDDEQYESEGDCCLQCLLKDKEHIHEEDHASPLPGDTNEVGRDSIAAHLKCAAGKHPDRG